MYLANVFPYRGVTCCRNNIICEVRFFCTLPLWSCMRKPRQRKAGRIRWHSIIVCNRNVYVEVSLMKLLLKHSELHAHKWKVGKKMFNSFSSLSRQTVSSFRCGYLHVRFPSNGGNWRYIRRPGYVMWGMKQVTFWREALHSLSRWNIERRHRSVKCSMIYPFWRYIRKKG